MVGQHYYTRERRGIFRAAEGYDSIAKSNNIKDDFIKKYLHPVCFYNAPFALEEKSDGDKEEYPAAYHFIQPETGEGVVGRSIYVSADFTGRRSTFFTHNYVVPENEKEKYIKDINRLLFVGDFASTYDIDSGTELQTISQLPYNKYEDEAATISIMQKELNISEEMYKKLLYALIESTSGKRKLYISLNVDISDISKYAKILLKFLFLGAPYDIRRNLGYITYVKEPESRKYINITFFESRGLRHGDTRFDRDFIFDFNSNRFLNGDMDLRSQPFIDFVWSRIHKPDEIYEFYEFADKILAGEAIEKKLNMNTYNELCMIYQVVKGSTELYASNRTEIFTNLFNYVNNSNIEKSPIHKEIFNDIFDREHRLVKESDKDVSHQRIISKIVDFYDKSEESIKSQIISLIFYNILKSNKNKNMQQIQYIFTMIEPHGELLDNILKPLSLGVKEVYNWYITLRVNKIKDLKGLFDEIDFWKAHSPSALQSLYFLGETQRKMESLLKEAQNKIAMGKKIHNYFEDLKADSDSQGVYKEYSEKMISASNKIVYDSIDLNTIPRQDIIELDYLHDYEGDNKYKVISLMRGLLNPYYRDAPSLLRDFSYSYSSGYRENLQNLIKRIFANEINVGTYDVIALAFVESFDMGRGDCACGRLFNYLLSKSEKEVYKFIIWSFKNSEFYSNYNMDKYKLEVKNFMIGNKDVFKKKEIQKMLEDANSKELNKIVKAANYELMSPLGKFFADNGRTILKWLTLSIVVIAVSAILAAGILWGINKLYKREEPPMETNQQEPGTGADVQGESPINEDSESQVPETEKPATDEDLENKDPYFRHEDNR